MYGISRYISGKCFQKPNTLLHHPAGFMPTVGLKLTVSWFLAWSLKHYSNQDLLCVCVLIAIKTVWTLSVTTQTHTYFPIFSFSLFILHSIFGFNDLKYASAAVKFWIGSKLKSPLVTIPSGWYLWTTWETLSGSQWICNSAVENLHTEHMQK